MGVGFLVGALGLAAETTGTGLGAAIAVADIDGDGQVEVAVGVDRASGSHPSGGEVAVYRVGPEGWIPWQTLVVPADGARGGAALALDGDLNGDGHPDLVVGAPGVERVYVWLGSPQGFPREPSWQSTTEDGYFGQAVAHVGDLDGDGYGDFAAGGPRAVVGRVVVYRGGPDGPREGWRLNSSVDNERFGWSLAAGTGPKGRPMLVVGAPDHDGHGRVVAYAWGRRGPKRRLVHDLRGARRGGQLGSALHVDPTGRWLAVGAPSFMAGEVGHAFVFDLVDGTRRAVVSGVDPRGSFGSAVLLPGDDRLVVSAFLRGGGAATSFQLGDDGEVTKLREDVRDQSPSGGFGWALASVDDLDGDGVRDVIVSTHNHPELRVADAVEVWRPDGEASDRKVTAPPPEP